jgi:hypothetical protein
MTPSEASVRLSSRAYFSLSLFSWSVRLRLKGCLFKIAHFSKQRRGGFHRFALFDSLLEYRSSSSI